jgi:hypothetical protein
MPPKVLLPAALLLLLSCAPENDRRRGDTGMSQGAPGGISSRDTMPVSGGDTARGREPADKGIP